MTPLQKGMRVRINQELVGLCMRSNTGVVESWSRSLNFIGVRLHEPALVLGHTEDIDRFTDFVVAHRSQVEVSEVEEGC